MSSPQDIELAHALSRLLGWSYFLCWGISFYPQIIINYNRKSVTGLAVDYFTVNVLGFSCYTVSSLAFLFSPVVRDEYARRHPKSPEPTVRWNDLAFAAHATATSVVVLSQFFCWGYKRDVSQRLSLTMLGVMAGCVGAIVIAILLVLFGVGGLGWIDVVYTLQWVKLFISIVKYVPQAWVNYKRKATTGWSIENILLDFAGGTLSLAQLVLDSSLQGDWSGLTGNPVKFFLGQIAILFDILFIVQHYILYPISSPYLFSPSSTSQLFTSSPSTPSPSSSLPSSSSNLLRHSASPSILPSDIERGYGTTGPLIQHGETARRGSLVEEEQRGYRKRFGGDGTAEETRGLLGERLDERIVSTGEQNGA